MLDASILEPLLTRQAQIAKRRSDVGARMAKLQKEDEGLAAEQEELATTLKTLSRVYEIDLGALEEAKNNKSSAKPEGTPTLFEMVKDILEKWKVVDDEPMEGDTIYDFIRSTYWPEAPRNSIIPSLWRFAKEGRLIKEGTAYALPPKNETPGAATPSASSLEEDLDDEIPF